MIEYQVDCLKRLKQRVALDKSQKVLTNCFVPNHQHEKENIKISYYTYLHVNKFHPRP